jgi:hypothetical protein
MYCHLETEVALGECKIAKSLIERISSSLKGIFGGCGRITAHPEVTPKVCGTDGTTTTARRRPRSKMVSG